MKLNNQNADIFVPDGAAVETALQRTTHLALSAHQDDLEIMAYPGIETCFQNPDRWFTGVVTTNGSGSPRAGKYAHTTDEEMQVIRYQEQRKAAYVGEYGAAIQLGFPSSMVKDASDLAVVQDFISIIRATRPEIVYVHNLADKHDTHVAVTLRAIQALREIKSEYQPQKVLGCEVWRNLDWMVDTEKVVLSASERPNISAALVGIFDSQISGGKRYDLATEGRRLSNATYSASHQTDEDTALIYAMDLTGLVTDASITPAAYTQKYIDSFRDDVGARIEKFMR